MDPFEYPSDAQIARWGEEYGTTGVKIYHLEQPDGHPDNRGAVAVYREISLAQRQLLSRLEDIDEDAPGVFDIPRMMVANCLLYPTVDAYPHPATAVAELSARIRQHGHGTLGEEPVISREEDEPGLPEHVVEDLRQAREAAYEVFHSPLYSSFYTNLILELATSKDGNIDLMLVDQLWRMSPGRIRDIAARVEQIHANIQIESLRMLHQNSEMDPEEKGERAKRLKDLYTSPFAGIDQAVGEAATPVTEDEEAEAAAQKQKQEKKRLTEEQLKQAAAQDLPPNRPPDISQAVRNANQQSQQ